MTVVTGGQLSASDRSLPAQQPAGRRLLPAQWPRGLLPRPAEVMQRSTGPGHGLPAGPMECQAGRPAGVATDFTRWNGRDRRWERSVAKRRRRSRGWYEDRRMAERATGRVVAGVTGLVGCSTSSITRTRRAAPVYESRSLGEDGECIPTGPVQRPGRAAAPSSPVSDD